MLQLFENYQQLSHRHAPSFIRDVLEAFSHRTLTAAHAADQLDLSRSRRYALATAYRRARAHKHGTRWIPGGSGGDHAAPWPQPVLDRLGKRLRCSPPCPYSFAASAALRLHDFRLDRAQVRRWALANHLAHAVPRQKVRAAVRRWQRHRIGELWQLDASPHRWFPTSPHRFPMRNLLADCSRLFTGSQLYERELLLSCFDFLPAAFLAHGRPLQLYVDYHSLFFTHDPDALTQLGWALKFCDISLRYAPPPQAKGKVEREHQFWQGRLSACFASEKITEIAVANPHINALRAHRNARAIHRELGQTRNPPGIRPGRNSAPPCGRPRAVPGDLMCGACAPPSRSAPTDACPSAPNDCGAKNHRAPAWCCAATPTATTPCWPRPPSPNKNPRSASPIAQPEPCPALKTTRHTWLKPGANESGKTRSWVPRRS